MEALPVQQGGHAHVGTEEESFDAHVGTEEQGYLFVIFPPLWRQLKIRS